MIYLYEVISMLAASHGNSSTETNIWAPLAHESRSLTKSTPFSQNPSGGQQPCICVYVCVWEVFPSGRAKGIRFITLEQHDPPLPPAGPRFSERPSCNNQAQSEGRVGTRLHKHNVCLISALFSPVCTISQSTITAPVPRC